MPKRKQSDEFMELFEESFEVLELFDGKSEFLDRLNELRRKWGLKERYGSPLTPERDPRGSGVRWSPDVYKTEMKWWGEHIYRQYEIKQSAFEKNLRRRAGLHIQAMQGDVAELCHDFGLWYPTWGHWIELLLVTNFLLPPPVDCVIRVEDRPADDPWAKRHPRRVVLELSDTTSATTLKTSARLILDAQVQAYGKRRISRKHFDLRLSDYARRLMRSRGSSTRDIQSAIGALQQEDSMRARGLPSLWKDRERKRKQAKRQRHSGASVTHPSTHVILDGERGNKETS